MKTTSALLIQKYTRTELSVGASLQGLGSAVDTVHPEELRPRKTQAAAASQLLIKAPQV